MQGGGAHAHHQQPPSQADAAPAGQPPDSRAGDTGSIFTTHTTRRAHDSSQQPVAPRYLSRGDRLGARDGGSTATSSVASIALRLQQRFGPVANTNMYGFALGSLGTALHMPLQLCRRLPRHAFIPQWAVLHCALPCPALPCHVMPCHVIAYAATLHHVPSHPTPPHHITPCHATHAVSMARCHATHAVSMARCLRGVYGSMSRMRV